MLMFHLAAAGLGLPLICVIGPVPLAGTKLVTHPTRAQLVTDRLPILLRVSPGFPPGSLGSVAAATIPFSAWMLSRSCAGAWPSWTICPR